MNEAQTRLELIDPKLREAGWGVVEDSRIQVEYPISQGRLIGNGRRAKPLSADYVLIYKNRRLAVIEAKKEIYTTVMVWFKQKSMQTDCKYDMPILPMV